MPSVALSILGCAVQLLDDVEQEFKLVVQPDFNRRYVMAMPTKIVSHQNVVVILMCELIRSVDEF